MPFKKGNKEQLKAENPGRKTKEEELATAVKNIEEKVTQEALIKLANSKVYKFLGGAKNLREVKELGLPITLKGMTEKVDHTTKGEKIEGIKYITPEQNGRDNIKT